MGEQREGVSGNEWGEQRHQGAGAVWKNAMRTRKLLGRTRPEVWLYLLHQYVLRIEGDRLEGRGSAPIVTCESRTV